MYTESADLRRARIFYVTLEGVRMWFGYGIQLFGLLERYIAHSSWSSVSERKGSSIDLIAMSPHRILFLCQHVELVGAGRRTRLTIARQPKHPTPFLPSLSSLPVRFVPAALVFAL